MRIKLTSLIACLSCGIFMMMCASASFAQTSSNQAILKFYHQENGKIATKNAMNQKVFNFEVSGLNTSNDVTIFKNHFYGRAGVISIQVGELINDERNATITFEPGTKGSYIRDLLIKAGINQVYIDGVLKSVDELGKDQ
jgi:hypothetical protein